MSSPFSEDHLIEQPTLELFRELGWQTTNGYHEFDSAPGAAGRSPLGRETAADVVLLPRLRQSLEKLNPGLPPEAVDLAIEELTRGRGTLSLAAANRELYRLIKDGVTVRLGADGAAGPGSRPETTITVRVVAWDEPENNDWLIVSQFWVLGELYTCRPDLVGFVNGLPLLLIELKAPGKGAAAAYKDNIRHYKEAIPQLLWYNALILATDGDSSRCGTLTADWERYYDWKRINDEGEKGVISWETMVRGLCAPARWLDLMENFILYDENQGGLAKIAAMNHQYLGTNNALRALRSLGENQGRLGVYWHTQGAGKSYSMIFFAQKALRKLGQHGKYDLHVMRRHGVRARSTASSPLWVREGELLLPYPDPDTRPPRISYHSLLERPELAEQLRGKAVFVAAGTGLLNYPLYVELLAKHHPNMPIIIEHLDESDIPRAKGFLDGVLKKVGV